MLAITHTDRESDVVLVVPSVQVTVMSRSANTGYGPEAAYHLKMRVLTYSRPPRARV